MSTEPQSHVDAREELLKCAHAYGRESDRGWTEDLCIAPSRDALLAAARAFVRAEQEQCPVTYWVAYQFGDTQADFFATLERPLRTKEDAKALRAYLKDREGQPVVILRCDRLETE